MHRGPRPGRPGAVPRLPCGRAQPQGQQRLRRLLAQQRDRDLPARRAHRRAHPGHRARAAVSPPAAPAGARGRDRARSAPTRSRSARTGATSTPPRCSATRSPSSPQPEDRRADASSATGAAASRAPRPPAAPPAARSIGPDVVVVSPDGTNVYVGSVLGQRGRGLRARPVDRRADPARRRRRLHRRGDQRLPARRASPWALRRAWRSAGDGDTVYVAAARLQRGRVLARDPSTGALTQATDGSGCIVRAPLTGCTTGTQLAGANAVAVSPDDGRRLRDLAARATASPPSRARRRPGGRRRSRDRRLPGLPALHRLLLRAGDERAGGPRRLARRGATSTSPPSPPARSTCSSATGSRRGHAEAAPPGCLAPNSVPGCTPRTGAARASARSRVSPDGRNLYSTAFGSNAVDIFRRNAMSQSRARQGGPDPQGAARLRRRRRGRRCCSPRAPAWSRRSPRARKARRKDVAGMNVLLFLTDQERAIQHFPPSWLRAEPAGADGACARHGLSFETRLHQRLHVLAGALDPDERLLPGPARRQVHARGRHAGRRSTRRSSCRPT